MIVRRIIRRIEVLVTTDSDAVLLTVLIVGVVILSFVDSGEQPLKIIITGIFAVSACILAWARGK